MGYHGTSAIMGRGLACTGPRSSPVMQDPTPSRRIRRQTCMPHETSRSLSVAIVAVIAWRRFSQSLYGFQLVLRLVNKVAYWPVQSDAPLSAHEVLGHGIHRQDPINSHQHVVLGHVHDGFARTLTSTRFSFEKSFFTKFVSSFWSRLYHVIGIDTISEV